jgi:hypothetical protein
MLLRGKPIETPLAAKGLEKGRLVAVSGSGLFLIFIGNIICPRREGVYMKGFRIGVI